MRLKALPALLLSLGASLAAYGCSADDINGTPLLAEGDDGGTGVDGGATTSSSSSSGGGSGGSCTPTPPPNLNPSTLPSCCTVGSAHCVPNQYVPAADKAALAACSGGYCVPDPFISNPNYTPPSCNAFNNTPGVCLSLCVPQVEQYKTILTQSSCAATELCAPCTNPLTKMPSGACEFKAPGQGGGQCSADGGASGSGGSGSSSGGGSSGGDAGTPAAQCPYKGPPILDPSTLPACGTAGGAHCLQSALVPMSMQSQLASCPGGFCVPDVFIESGGNFIPPTCSSLDSAEGRCLNENIPQVAAQVSQLQQATCQSYERCVPCFSPIDGSKTGACNLSCDPGPTKPIVLFPSCCKENGTNDGRCVPSTIISSTEQKNLSSDSCQNKGDLCVPSEMLSSSGTSSFKPPTCTATGFLIGQYTGVCLSNCLSFGIQGLTLAQGSCDDVHTCAPCTNPLTGQPTGAPGCP
jgi:hypothetical protein